MQITYLITKYTDVFLFCAEERNNESLLSTISSASCILHFFSTPINIMRFDIKKSQDLYERMKRFKSKSTLVFGSKIKIIPIHISLIIIIWSSDKLIYKIK